MRSWLLAESLLREGKAYYGRGQVKYQDLVKLFDYIRDEPKGHIQTWDPRGKGSGSQRLNYPHRYPAKDGGTATANFNVTSVWDPWFVDPAKAISMATSADAQHLTRTTYVPHVGAMGKKGWSVGTKDLPNDPKMGPAPKDFEARPTDLYDFVVQGEMTNVPENPKGPTYFGRSQRTGKKETQPGVVATRIAWTPSVGDPTDRAERLRSLLSGQQPILRTHQRELPSGPEAPKRMPPATQAPSSAAGETPRSPKPGEPDYDSWLKAKQAAQAERGYSASGVKVPPRGTPERAAWDQEMIQRHGVDSAGKRKKPSWMK